MTPTAILVAVVGLICGVVTLIVMFRTVLREVRVDAVVTGKTNEQMTAFANKLVTLEANRAEVLKEFDMRIAAALQVHYDTITRREADIVEAVKGFRTIVDELKNEWATVSNQWANERRLIVLVRRLEMEVMQLRTEHTCNHPMRDSQRILLQQGEEGSPNDDWGKEGCNR